MPDDHDELLPTHRSLLERLGRLDDKSWYEFFQTYWKFIYTAARRAGLSDVEAQEVVQETVIYAARKLPTFQYNAHGSFKAWLNKLIQWRVADQFQKRDGRVVPFTSPDADDAERFLEIADPAPPLHADMDEEWDRNLYEAAVQRAKAQVSARQFQIFELAVTKQWPIKQITQALGVSFPQVYLAKHRVTALIREEFKKLRERD